MTVTAVRKDPDALTLSVESEFRASPERIWQLWADPRQLERWWGPPTYPATVTAHDIKPGGRVEYHMTGPDGDQPRGFWDVLDADPPRSLHVRDGFANADGTPNSDMPLSDMQVAIVDIGDGRTRMTMTTTFADIAAMEQLVAMGMEEGVREALGQIDAILAEEASAPTA